MALSSTPEAAAWVAALDELSHLEVVRVAPRGSADSSARSSTPSTRPPSGPGSRRPYALDIPGAYLFAIPDVPDNQGWARVAAETMRRHNREPAAPSHRDPRGWANRGSEWVEFTVTDGPALLPYLDEVGWRAAEECLRTRPWDVTARTDVPAVDAAQTLLGRFGRRARYYANDSPTPLAARDHSFVQCSNNLVTVTCDIGLVVVSDDEVGVFWSAADD